MLFTSLISLTFLTLSIYAYDSVHIRINGFSTEVEAKLINSTTYVNLHKMNNLLGNKSGTAINIEADTGDCYITARGRYIGGSDCLDIDGSLYAPIRSIAEVYNAGVEWIGSTQSVDINVGINYGLISGDNYYIQDEVYWLSRIINAESKGEPMRGKILVGNVILNRMFSDDFPNTIYDVIYDKEFGVQFTPTINGTILEQPEEESIIAAKICLDAYYISRDALYFLNPAIATSMWITSNRDYLTTVGSHDFYS